MLAIAASTSSLAIGSSLFKVRPYSSLKDNKQLNEICKDVWNNTDYVPKIAHIFEADPTCDFLVMEDEETGELVAAGNRRNFDDEGKTIWIESIRVSSKYQGRGIATALMKELIQRSKSNGACEILSCTVHDNYAMKKVFDRVELDFVSDVQWQDFAKMKALPGWAASDTEREPKNILRSLDIENLVQEDARSENWERVENEEELKLLLAKVEECGGVGHLPGLGKLLWSSDALRDSIRDGLVRKLKRSNDSPPAMIALVKDSAIHSLRSKYVCSIIATTAHDFDSALWEACSVKNIPAFTFALDGCNKLCSGTVLDKVLVKRENTFVIYRSRVEDQ